MLLLLLRTIMSSPLILMEDVSEAVGKVGRKRSPTYLISLELESIGSVENFMMNFRWSPEREREKETERERNRERDIDQEKMQLSLLPNPRPRNLY